MKRIFRMSRICAAARCATESKFSSLRFQMIRVVVTLYGVPKLITAEVPSSVLFTGKAKLCSGGKQIVIAQADAGKTLGARADHENACEISSGPWLGRVCPTDSAGLARLPNHSKTTVSHRVAFRSTFQFALGFSSVPTLPAA